MPTLLLLNIYLFSFQPGSVQAVVGEVTPGAETNMDKLPYTSPTTGNIIQASADFNDIQSKVNSAQPGDIIEVADGTISSSASLQLSNNGTASARIVVRAKNVNGVTISSCPENCFNITGSYYSVEGFRFTNNNRFNVTISGGSAAYNAIYNNTFDKSGSGADGSNSSIIKVFASQDKVYLTHNIIVKNTFLQPKNPAVYDAGGAGGTVITHNIIRGPHGINGGEREAFKNQCCGSEPSGNYGLRIQFNSFYNWGTTQPYIASFKRDGNYFDYNKIVSDASGDNKNLFSARSANNKIAGNAMYGQSAMFEVYNGSDSLVIYNKLFSTGT